MATDSIQKKVGRVFCVTGFTSPGGTMRPAVSTTSVVCQSDTDSNSSGYLSSSSFESSGEEKRLGLNEQKVFQVWEKWSRQRDQPKSSTPKNTDCTYKGRLELSGGEGRSVLSIKKDFRKKETRKSQSDGNDSFWDIVTPQLFKSRSENDMRSETDRFSARDLKCDLFDSRGGQMLSKHDAGSVPNMSTTRHTDNRPKSGDWKRKPFHTLSTSDQDLRNSGNDSSSRDMSQRGYQTLPRYRVVVGESLADRKSSSNELVHKLSASCADFMDSGVPVDESMTEFLASVDKDNLASFLNFYDKITKTSEYERAKRNPKNYEAVYY